MKSTIFIVIGLSATLMACLGSGSGVIQEDAKCEVSTTWLDSFKLDNGLVKETKGKKVYYWTPEIKKGFTWDQANDYCNGLRIKGKKWKLPSKTQGGWLLSATCEVKKDCWMVPVFKDCTDFWTTTNTNSGKEKVYYFVDPKFGGGGFDHKDRKHGVICIATQ